MLTVPDAEAHLHAPPTVISSTTESTTVTGDDAAPADASLDPEDLEKLTVLTGVRAFPVRVKCATLAWHTLNAAIEGKEESSSE